MPKKFRTLAARTMSKASRARATKRTKTMLAEMHLNELRRARELSQQALAKRLGTTQPEVSRLESRTDMYLSTLRRFVEAIGDELVIVAEFPDGAVRISQFAELDRAS